MQSHPEYIQQESNSDCGYGDEYRHDEDASDPIDQITLNGVNLSKGNDSE